MAPKGSVDDWMSSAIPSTIRRPWRVFEEDVEDKLQTARDEGQSMSAALSQLGAVRSLGAKAAFLELPEAEQRHYAGVSLTELAAFASWRRDRMASLGLAALEQLPPEEEAAWDLLDMDGKAEWIPDDEDIAAALSKDGGCWASLLVDGPPLCGSMVIKGEPKDRIESASLGAAATSEASRQREAKAAAAPAPPSSKVAAAKSAPARPSSKVAAAKSTPAQPSSKVAAAESTPAPPSSSRAFRKRKQSSQDATPQRKMPKTRGVRCPKPAASRKEAGCKIADVAVAALAESDLCPEALTAVCCICADGEAAPDNDIGICDGCDKPYHQKCHDPEVPHFGRPEEQWFCSTCVKEIASERKLELSRGEYAWVRYGSLQVPAKVAKVDFTSKDDPTPYWVNFFDDKNTGAWIKEVDAVPWLKGPSYASIRDAARRRAVTLAEADGAPDISSSCEQGPAPFGRRRVATSGSSKPAGLEAAAVDEQLQRQVEDVQKLIEAAKARKLRLEEELSRTT